MNNLFFFFATVFSVNNSVDGTRIPVRKVNEREQGISSNELNLVVKVRNELGLNYVKDNAVKVNNELEGFPYIGVTMTMDEAEKLPGNEDIEMFDIDYLVHAMKKLPNLRKLAETTPWGIEAVLEDLQFWEEIDDPSGSMKVCVADTGYDLGHEDLPVEPNVDGTDHNENGLWNNDEYGHGTHCSGTVAALGGNNKGVSGVIPNNKGGKFQLIIGKALDNDGYGSFSGVLVAVQHCIDKGAKVVSLSLGGGGFSQTTNDYFQEKYEAGILFVAAAGNYGSSAYTYPASYPALMSVAAIDSNENKASFSQYNDQVEISGPGVSVLSTIPVNKGGPYDSWSGTSMATPHVAGVAGLVWMYFPNCTNVQIRHVLLHTAKDLGPGGCDTLHGFGLVQAKAAYDLLSEGNCGGDIGPIDPKGGCQELYEIPPPPCTSDTDCDDSHPCTIDSCDVTTGICINDPISTGIVQVNITTDYYPTETSWHIASTRNPYEFLMSGGNYSDQFTLYTKSKSLLSCGEIYTFSIYDSFGDGICCFEGNGYYSVTVEGYLVLEGGEFGESEHKEFIVDTNSTWTTITYDNFDNGWGSYESGYESGSDKVIISNKQPHSGDFSARISGSFREKASFMHKTLHDVTSFDTLRVNFWYYTKNLDVNDKIFIHYYNSTHWKMLEKYEFGVDFFNDIFNEDSVTLDASSIDFIKLRFRFKGRNGVRQVFIDDVIFSGM